MWCYARILTHYPYVVLSAVLVVTITCLIVTVTIGDRPSFEEPMAGFEPRGTEISNRLIAYEHLLESPSLTPTPTLGGSSGSSAVVMQQRNNHLSYVDETSSPGEIDDQKNVTMTTRFKSSGRRERRAKSGRKKFYYFCEMVPDSAYAKVVYHSAIQEDLLTTRNIRAMCQIEQQVLFASPIFQSTCLRNRDQTSCCRSLNIGNYIALYFGKQSCLNITDADVRTFRTMVNQCVGFYLNYTLPNDCDWRNSPYGWAGSNCRNIPKACYRYNIMYNVLHYMTDRSFQKVDGHLRYALSFLPVSYESGQLERVEAGLQLYIDLEARLEQQGGVEIVAADFGLKDQLFSHYLSQDSKWITASGVFIFFIVWIFTSSIFITIMTFMSMFWSLELAYFLYVFVFEIHFFPYMNLVTVLLVIAIGADDVFVYTKIWHLAKKERNNGTLEKLVSDTLRHATLSMFVTSMTTAGALFANVVSPITSVKCFSIYAGTTMVCNLVLMVTWTPAVIVAEEKWCNFCFINSPKIYKKLKGYCRSFFERMIPAFVMHLRFAWIVVLGAIGIFSGVLVFHYPKLRLPTSFRFQVFRGEHYMEMYDQELRQQFWFENVVSDRKPLMPLTFVWGVQEVDNGNKLNPKERGTLVFDDTFNPMTSRSQAWLKRFCQDLRHTEFYQKMGSIEISNCYIEQVYHFMSQRCSSREQICCNKTQYPYPEALFRTCVHRYISEFRKQTVYVPDKYSPGLRFKGPEAKALIIQFSSNVTFTYDYVTMGEFYTSVNKWMYRQLLQAPEEMGKGWFVSELKYYNLQKSLAEGLPVAFGISVVVALLVTFLTSLNVLVTMYAILTIAFIMLVTIGSIVLLDWELNILESVIITVAVGLSIDHTLHYGVAYRLAPDLDRSNRVYCSLVRVGSVIFVAAVTTFLAGAFMLPSVTLVYQKFGIFLMLVICISWTYSTLFFQSLLNVIGPQGGFGQFHWPSLDCCSLMSQTRTDRTVYSMSESTMSTSSSGYPYHPSIDTNATEHEFLQDRNDSHPGTPYHYRTRPGRHYSRPKSESVSPDNQSHRKLLNSEEKVDSVLTVNVDVPDVAQDSPDKLCTEV